MKRTHGSCDVESEVLVTRLRSSSLLDAFEEHHRDDGDWPDEKCGLETWQHNVTQEETKYPKSHNIKSTTCTCIGFKKLDSFTYDEFA